MSDGTRASASAISAAPRFSTACARSAELRISVPAKWPAVERPFQPSTTTRPLHKDGREAADFLSRLALVYKVFELEGRPGPLVLLHPTSYSFGFTDSEGNSHGFEYGIEASRHHDDTYRGLVEEFEQFFEVRRISRSDLESANRPRPPKPPEPPGRRGRLRRKFWYLISLFFNR